jgi:penicillin-binding protein 1A
MKFWKIYTAVTIFLTTALIVFWYLAHLPKLEELEQKNSTQIAYLLYNNSQYLANRGDLYRSSIEYYELPPHLIQAVVAIEDRRFFQHFGIDIWSIIRAYFANYRAQKIVQGGSTITQQLAKLLFLKPEKTWHRKIQEAMLAIQLERKFSKEQILTFYLNKAYFGSGNYGIGNAARYYFRRDVSRLTLYQSALLAGLLKAPSKISPKNNPQLAKERAGIVLQAMRDAGFINNSDSQELIRIADDSDHYLYFADYAYTQVSDYKDRSLHIRTTLDYSLQTKLQQVIDSYVKKLNDKQQIAMVVMGYDGAIKAMSGGVNYWHSQFNRAVASKRQVGSAFKTFIYLAAFANGYNLDSKFSDKKISYGNWLPDNFNNKYLGDIDLLTAFAKSSNSVAIQLAKELGATKIINMARKCGIVSDIANNDLTIALGSSSLSLLELVGAYASIANAGNFVLPFAINEIRDDKQQILYSRQPLELPKIFTANVADKILTAFRQVVADGTGKNADIDEHIFGKTGTSQNHKDAWFVGFDRKTKLIAGVWLGYDDNRLIQQTAQKITGGDMPAKIFRSFITEARTME